MEMNAPADLNASDVQVDVIRKSFVGVPPTEVTSPSKASIALDVAKEWVSSVEFSIAVGVYPLPSPDALIKALTSFAEER